MKLIEKQSAIALRKKGQSLSEIARRLNVSKASVSEWVRDVVLDGDQVAALRSKGFTTSAIEKRRASRLHGETMRRVAIIDEAERDITSISAHELKLLGIALYWAEGGKTQNVARLSNSDPKVIQLMMRFFREVCGVPETKFRLQIHTHSHLNAKKSEEYWANVTKLPLGQFFKTYSKPSKASLNKKDSLPYGTIQIYVCDSRLLLKIKGWISKIQKLTAI